MRNIEEVAAEEELRSRRDQRRFLRRALNAAGLALGLLGWTFFSQGDLGSGAFWILLSLAAFLVGWGAHRLNAFPWSAWGMALPVAAAVLGLDLLTGLPSFYWGRDPDFFLAVQAGQVTAPLWSPLTYLVAQAASFALPDGGFNLPVLSAVLAAACFFGLVMWWTVLVRERTLLSVAVVWAAAAALALSRPFWDAGTLASGSVALLGLALFLWQRMIIRAGQATGPALGLLGGLLFSVHPAWGILGLLSLLLADHLEVDDRPRAFLFFAVGLTPYLWVAFRALQCFPSWGGGSPFGEWFSRAGELAASHFSGDWSWGGALAALGWAFLPLTAAAVLFWIFRRKTGGLSFQKRDLALWAAALLLAVLFAEPAAGHAGPTALWALAGLIEVLIRSGERHFDRRTASGPAPGLWAGVLAGAAALAVGAAFLPDQACLRQGFSFPAQHALNLIRGLPPRGVLICGDPFDASACRVERLAEPLTPGILILDQDGLNREWYLSELILRDPRLLFSKISGSTGSVVQDLVASNEGNRTLQWDRTSLPEGWTGPPAYPGLLTECFSAAPPPPETVEDIQARYDLTSLLQARGSEDPATQAYYGRYVAGFDGLGRWLLAQERYSGAIRSYERALSLAPDDADSKQALASIYTQDNMLEAARMDFEHIVRTYPTRIRKVMAEMDRMKMKNGANDAQVMDMLNETVRLNNVLADAQFHLGKLYEQQGRSQEAEKLLQAAVRMNPQRVEAQMELARLMEKTGNLPEAEEAFRGVLKADPQNKPAQTELWKLLNKP